MKIVVDKDIPFLRGVLEPFAELVYLPGDKIVAEDVRDADALLVRTRTRCNEALLSRSHVRFIGTATIGFDHIDMDWCTVHGIRVATAAGCNRRGVLQWAGAALAWLAGEHPSAKADGNINVDFFSHRGFKPPEITLGVVGAGNVGSLVAEYAASWGFRVMCSDPPRERLEGLGPAEGFYPLPTLAAKCDIITFHVPLTSTGPDPTLHLVDRDFLAASKPGAVILNSSRGAVTEPAALREAARGNSHSFIIDTWNDEPAIDREVLARTLLGTPHIAGYSVQGKAGAAAMTIDALSREFSLPLTNWYPDGTPRSTPRTISWEDMCRAMPSYFDIAAESAALKAAPALFERMRDNYRYRTEFF